MEKLHLFVQSKEDSRELEEYIEDRLENSDYELVVTETPEVEMPNLLTPCGDYRGESVIRQLNLP